MPGPAVAPASLQAFTLDAYFNSTGTDPAETPTLKNGIVLPSNWGSSGMGVKAWRREWRVQLPPGSPGNPFWNPGVRLLKARASSGLNSNYFPANNDTLGINAWDLLGPSQNPPPSTVTNASVQVTAYYYNASGVQTFVDPSTIFASYCWGLYDIQRLVSFPAPASGNCSSLSQAAANPVQTIMIGSGLGVGGGNHFDAGPNTLQQMNVGGVATLLFVPLIPPPPRERGPETTNRDISDFDPGHWISSFRVRRSRNGRGLYLIRENGWRGYARREQARDRNQIPAFTGCDSPLEGEECAPFSLDLGSVSDHHA